MTWQLYQAAILILLQITNGSHSFGLHHLSDSLNLINTDFPPRGTFFFLWKFATKPMAHRKVLPPTSFGLSGFRSVIIFVSAKSSLSYYLFRSLQRVALPSRLARRPALCLSATWPLRSATPSLRSPAMDDPKFIDELREKLSRTLQTYQTTHERACTIADSIYNNISTVVSNLSDVEKFMIQVNNRMLDKRLDSGETSSNGETDLDSDKTEPDSNKTAESTSSQSRGDYLHGEQIDHFSQACLNQNPHMLPTSIQEDFAEILNTRGVPIEDQSDRISKSLLKADYMHFESGCSRTLHVDNTQGPRNTVDTAQSPSNPVDTAQSPSNPVDTAQSPSNPVDTAQSPSNPVDTAQSPSNPVDTAQSPSNPVDTAQSPSNPVDTSNNWLPLGLGGVLLIFLLFQEKLKLRFSS